MKTKIAERADGTWEVQYSLTTATGRPLSGSVGGYLDKEASEIERANLYIQLGTTRQRFVGHQLLKIFGAKQV
jgi:hypothetical protein